MGEWDGGEHIAQGMPWMNAVQDSNFLEVVAFRFDLPPLLAVHFILRARRRRGHVLYCSLRLV